MNGNGNGNGLSKTCGCPQTKRVFDPETGEEVCKNCGQTYHLEHDNDTTPPPGPIKHTHHTFTKLAKRDYRRRKISSDYTSVLSIAQSVYGKKEGITIKRRAEEADLVDLVGRARLGLNPSVIKRAEYFINKCEAKDIGFWRRNRAKGITAVCLYLASKELGVPRHFTEYAKAAGISQKGFRRIYKMVIETLDTQTNPWGPKEYRYAISHLCNVLKFPKIERQALKMFDKTGQSISAGRNRSAMAAAYVYLACVQAEDAYMTTQKEIAKAAGTSTVSLYKTAKLIEKELTKHNDSKNDKASMAPTKR